MANEKKLFTREEVKNNKDPSMNLFIVHDKVYDVGKFLNEHPGGEEVLADQRGKDASEAYDDVGHSEDAKEMMVSWMVGEVVDADKRGTKPKKVEWIGPKVKKQETESSGLPYGLIAAAVIIVFLAYNLGIFSSSS